MLKKTTQKLTVADLFHLPYGTLASRFGQELGYNYFEDTDKRPNVARYD